MQGDGIAFDGEQDAKDAGPAAVEHLPQGDAHLLGFVLGDGMPLRHLGQLCQRFFQAGKPAGSDGGRAVGQEVELLHSVGPRSGSEDDAIGHRPGFLPKTCRSSASTSSAGMTLPAFMSSTEALRASIRSARSASSINF